MSPAPTNIVNLPYDPPSIALNVPSQKYSLVEDENFKDWRSFTEKSFFYESTIWKM